LQDFLYKKIEKNKVTLGNRIQLDMDKFRMPVKNNNVPFFGQYIYNK